MISQVGYMVEKPESRVRELRLARGLSSAELARRSGIQPPTLSKIELGQRGVTRNFAPALARALKVDQPDLYAPIGTAVPPEPETALVTSPFTPDSTVRLGPPLELPPAASMPRDLPVYGTVEGGPDGEFELLIATDLAVDMMRRPPGLAGLRNVFALYTVGESMSPWREPGDPVFVHPDRQAKAGQYAVVVLRPKDEHSPRRAMVKRYVATRGGKVIVEQFTPRKTIDLPQVSVAQLWRVIDYPEAFGFA